MFGRLVPSLFDQLVGSKPALFRAIDCVCDF